MSVRIVALLALAASLTLAPASANAGLFGCRSSCDTCAPTCGCEMAPTCGCEIAPSCGCEVADPCCDSGCGRKRGGFLKGLLSKFSCKKSCCDDGCSVEPSCGCEYAAPTCGCEMAPSCGCEMAPSCGCEMADPCCDTGCGCGSKRRGGLLKGLFSKLGCKKSCCDTGCDSYEASCGCEIAAPTCGCAM